MPSAAAVARPKAVGVVSPGRATASTKQKAAKPLKPRRKLRSRALTWATPWWLWVKKARTLVIIGNGARRPLR